MSIPPITQNKNNLPIYTMIMAGILVLAAVLLLIFAPARNTAETDLIIGLVVSSVPGLVASAFSERNNRDIRNGVVEQKAKQGTLTALAESGVQAVVDASGQGTASTLAMRALAQLLDNNASIHVETHAPEPPTPPVTPPTPPVAPPAAPAPPAVPPASV